MLNVTTRKNKILRFLKHFGEPVLCFALTGDRSSKMINGVNIDELLKRNSKGHDAYFYVNSGGTRLEEVNKINALYIDLDVGKKPDGNYYPSTYVSNKKKTMLAAVRKFGKEYKMLPTFIVETRNGFHVYWLLKGVSLGDSVKKRNLLVNRWRVLEYKLLNHFEKFGADKWAIRLNQILRLPYTVWSKGWTGFKNFEVRLLHSNPHKEYTLSQVENLLFGLQTMSAREVNPSNTSMPWTKWWEEKDRLKGKDPDWMPETGKTTFVIKKRKPFEKLSKEVACKVKGSDPMSKQDFDLKQDLIDYLTFMSKVCQNQSWDASYQFTQGLLNRVKSSKL